MYQIIYRINFEDWLVGEDSIGYTNTIKEAMDIFNTVCKSLDSNYHELDEFIERSVFQEDLNEEENKEILEDFGGGFCIEIYNIQNDISIMIIFLIRFQPIVFLSSLIV